MKCNREKFCKLLMVLFIELLIGMLFDYMGLSEIHIFTIYVIGMLITALLTESILYTMLSVSGLLIFNYFFSEPIKSFQSVHIGDPMTFYVLIIAAAIVGWMARRNAEQLKDITGRTEQRQIMVNTSNQLISAKGKQEIIEITANRMRKMTGMSVIVFIKEGDKMQEPQVFLAEGKDKLSFEINQQELDTVNMVYEAKSNLDLDIEMLEKSNGFYLKIKTTERCYGVIGLDIDGKRLEYKRTTLVLGECALAFERDYYNQYRQEAAIKARNEKLRTDLLRSISHDIRTPLTGMCGNAALLMDEEEYFTGKQVADIGRSIWEDGTCLISQVENILSITKLEEVEKNIVVRPELLEDILTSALEYATKHHTKHHFNLTTNENLHVVSCNAQLIAQVLRNLLDNAAHYTKEGSTVDISIKEEIDEILVEVRDNGCGIPEECIPNLFDMFYTTSNTASIDTQRGFGIGLTLCKMIVETHGGQIFYENAVPHGAIFTFSIKKAR